MENEILNLIAQLSRLNYSFVVVHYCSYTVTFSRHLGTSRLEIWWEPCVTVYTLLY